MGRLPLARPLFALERLHEPFSKADKLSGQQRTFYQVVHSFKKECSNFIGDATLPRPATITDFLQVLTDETLDGLWLLPIPEQPELLALRQLVLVIVTLTWLLDLVS